MKIKLITIYCLVTLLACSGNKSVMLKEDSSQPKDKSFLLLKVHIDNDFLKQNKVDRQPFRLIFQKFSVVKDGGPNTKEVSFRNLRTGEMHVLELEPGIYTLIKGDYKDWRESYAAKVIFNVRRGSITYPGDIYLSTKIIDSSLDSTFAGDGFNGGGGMVRETQQFYMEQKTVVHNETIKAFKQKYPLLSQDRKLDITRIKTININKTK